MRKLELKCNKFISKSLLRCLYPSHIWGIIDMLYEAEWDVMWGDIDYLAEICRWIDTQSWIAIVELDYEFHFNMEISVSHKEFKLETEDIKQELKVIYWLNSNNPILYSNAFAQLALEIAGAKVTIDM